MTDEVFEKKIETEKKILQRREHKIAIIQKN